jgi:hypothetical protein
MYLFKLLSITALFREPKAREDHQTLMYLFNIDIKSFDRKIVSYKSEHMLGGNYIIVSITKHVKVAFT